jgi:type IV fimbrial biogenesis protein FimT
MLDKRPLRAEMMQSFLGKKHDKGRAGRGSGFSLVELMVTVAVAAILLAIAFPSFTSLINSNRLTGQANDLVGALQLARMDAIRYNRRSVLCKTTDGTTCSAVAGTWTRWLSYVDTNGNGAPAANEIQRSGVLKPNILVLVSPAISGNGNQVVFRAEGLAHNNAGGLLRAAISACMATTRPAENVRELRIVSGSRILVQSLSGSGACAAPGNPP